MCRGRTRLRGCLSNGLAHCAPRGLSRCCRVCSLLRQKQRRLGDYDWCRIDIPLPNGLFTNAKQFEGDIIGTGVLDIFDRYNFTVNEAEPLEKACVPIPNCLNRGVHPKTLCPILCPISITNRSN